MATRRRTVERVPSIASAQQSIYTAAARIVKLHDDGRISERDTVHALRELDRAQDLLISIRSFVNTVVDRDY